MNGIIIRYHFQDPNPVRTSDLVDLLKQTYGGAISFIASDTIFIDTKDDSEIVYDLLSGHFTYDDKLFVGSLNDFQSMHNISRTRTTFHKVAI